MESRIKVDLPKVVDFNDVDFHNLLAIYNKKASRVDRLSESNLFGLDYKAQVVKDEDEILAGFLFTEKKPLNIEIVNKYGSKKNIYISGIVSNENGKFKSVIFFKFLDSFIRKQKNQGFIVWGLVSDKNLIDKYKKMGHEIIYSPNEEDEYAAVVFN